MQKVNKVIFIDTITREFIKFAKIMGIFPRVCFYFKEHIWNGLRYYEEEEIRYFGKGSFYEWARIASQTYNLLNESIIKYVYLFASDWKVWYDENGNLIGNINEADELASLFLSHLREKGYPRYIRIIH